MVACFSLVAIAVLALGMDEEPSAPDFNSKIKPILSNRCFLCHGPDESSREAGLRLDNQEDATQYAIVPGSAESSEFYLRITETDVEMQMPPTGHGSKLSVQEIDLIKRWIDSGAKYEKHWSYVPPKRDAKTTDNNDWAKNQIDHFVLEKLTEQGLSPSPAADRASIIRRLALDLTGLPPTVEESDLLYRSQSESEYESMVEHFLSKKAFGERWAAVWLDHARYADSMGYAEDRNRNIWVYRDYVIRSINENKPFDQFTVEQLAGDLLENPSKDQLIATAFHRNTLTNTEGGTIDEEFRSAAVVDRTNTTMAVWMGTTMACAQCHTHKYDPITQEEYFQIYAFFNSTADNDQLDDSPLLKIYSKQQQQQIKDLESKIHQIESQVAAWESKTKAQKNKILGQLQLAWESEINRYESNKVTGRFVRLELPTPNAFLSLAEIEIFVDGNNIAGSGQASQSSTAYSGLAELAIDGNTDGDYKRGKSVTHTAKQNNPWWELKLDQGYELDRIVVWNRNENLHERLNGVEISVLDSNRKRLWKHSILKAKPEPQEFSIDRLPERIFAIVTDDEQSVDEQEELQKYFANHFNPNGQRLDQIKQLKQQLRDLVPYSTVPVMSELEDPRETFVHIRGSYLDRGKQVQRAVPTAFHPLEAETRDRLALANWIVSKENPLTARVIANRFWQHLFGIGIVATGEEFGSQGELPSHPRLLDYLACDFMDNDWDVKSLLKQIVMSATYRQSSSVNKMKMQKDPNNRWLSRGPRFRLSAEMIRDQALACSGLLSSKMYGPPAQPPQPKSGLKFAFGGGAADWEDSVGEDRYRRAIYTRWQRSSPYPSMTTFDLSNREVCDLGRLRTNTPLQALVTLNDPVYVEAAQALARKVFVVDQSPQQIADAAFHRCLLRRPTEQELKLLIELYGDAKEHFKADVQLARKFAEDLLNPVPADTDWIELAAWTTVANTILNLDEMFLKR